MIIIRIHNRVDIMIKKVTFLQIHKIKENWLCFKYAINAGVGYNHLSNCSSIDNIYTTFIN